MSDSAKRYIDSVGGEAHQSAVDIIETLEAEKAELKEQLLRLCKSVEENAYILAEEQASDISDWLEDAGDE